MAWFLLASSGTSQAQWRHFGEDSRAAFARTLVAAHNEARARVGVAPLEWSDRLAALSQEWADHLLSRRKFAHRPNSAFGENLFEITGASASPAQVVDAWVKESRIYDYTSNICRGVCGHYTQVVWNATKAVGCAVARGGGREVWVCEYDLPGNFVGQRPY
jgi:uncharacterized protein YkwD